MSPKRVPAPGRPLAPLCLALCLAGCAGDNDVSIGSIAYVVLAQSGPEVDPAFATASADFRRADDDSGNCTAYYYTYYCRYWECVGDPTPGLDGGTVRITGEQDLELTNDDDYKISVEPPLWTADETIDVEFEGTDDDLPALTVSLDAPELVGLADPDPFPETLPKDEDLSLDWTGGNGIGVVLSVRTPPDEDDDVRKSVVCYWPLDPSEGVLPGVLLELLPAGPANVELSTHSYREQYAGTWAYGVTAAEYDAVREITLE